MNDLQAWQTFTLPPKAGATAGEKAPRRRWTDPQANLNEVARDARDWYSRGQADREAQFDQFLEVVHSSRSAPPFPGWWPFGT
jgi:hypothetical protein